MNARRMLIVQIVVILVVLIAGFVGYYYYNQSTTYLKTDDAQVTGQQIVIAAPATGKLTNWDGTVGTQFNAGDNVGTIQVPSAKGTTSVDVPDPQSSTIVQNMAVNNEFVAAGTPLAYAYNLNNLWVTANIKETQINDVKVGQAVDVYIDAYPGTTFSGVVKQIGLATASTFSLLPTASTDANYTKVTQVIPVQIQIQSGTGRLAPGMNASVRIHK
ncbi:efflux RND transporter periplasmic adaptor subunit [Alicyclobacillus fastidiosus]|uniref:Efflux RND transporter periplasmic adaptor subunit n=2 Tax=Alicyclobacillus fastidiosus TaxID=392011 RepID=A0ABY6ZIL1_9BACL|nr:efflux RND transporter periplasmic adaptor subunit [Alicyclobacillus fastidiosus]WAH42748.1 efflux RND transporter periplasmic adaptor subunit [Alicyclobacillus fastidiosus]GMA64658.1 multidrug resistance protein A [Alicyclobacillus fastidiosus]